MSTLTLRTTLAALLATGLLTALAASPAAAQSHESHEMHSRTMDGHRTLEVRARGKVEFTDDDRDVRRISPGGHLVIEEHLRGSSARRVEFTPGPDGGVRRVYRVNGETRGFDPGARLWLARILPETVRETGVGARERVARILAREGVPGVLEEISRIRSDGVQRVYFAALLDHSSLRPDDVARVLRQAGRQIGSDGDRASLLRRAALRGDLENDAVRRAFFDAVGTIGSDGDRASVLRRVLERERASEALRTALLRSAAEIGSDGDKSSVLVQAARRYPLSASATRAAFFESVGTIGSDGDHARVLKEVLRGGALTREVAVAVLRSARGIGSDGDKTAVLLHLPVDRLRDRVVADAYRDTAESIGSDGNRARALSFLSRTARGVAPRRQRI
ncbi:MAG TPA: hypothetical protein VHG28_23830 [Longimicrobiaceae bacterium]|nr:hypothetical protein [Longimicrobiaceae bacterium]